MKVPKVLTADHERYEGVRPINIYLLRLMFVLIVLFVGSDSWSALIKRKGDWNPVRAAAISMWAGFAVVAAIGIFRPLKMLPLVLFEIVYKLIWLGVVAYPLWAANRLAGSPAEEMTQAFLWVVLPIVAMPWRYAFRTYFGKPKIGPDGHDNGGSPR